MDFAFFADFGAQPRCDDFAIYGDGNLRFYALFVVADALFETRKARLEILDDLAHCFAINLYLPLTMSQLLHEGRYPSYGHRFFGSAGSYGLLAL